MPNECDDWIDLSRNNTVMPTLGGDDRRGLITILERIKVEYTGIDIRPFVVYRLAEQRWWMRFFRVHEARFSDPARTTSQRFIVTWCKRCRQRSVVVRVA